MSGFNRTSLYRESPRLLRLGLGMALAIPIILLGNGCIYRSEIKNKIPPPPEAFANNKEGDAKSVNRSTIKDAGQFWRLFGDPTLNRLVDLALKQNLDLELAWARQEQARAQLTIAGASTWPGVNAKLEGGRSSSQMSLGSFGAQTVTRNTLQISASVSYELDVWGKVRYAARAAKHDLRASEEDLRAAYLSLAAQLTESYFLTTELRAQLLLLEQTIASNERHVKLVQRRYSEGVVTALDLYQAKGNLAGAKARRSIYNRQLKVTEHAMAVMLGQVPGKEVSGSLDQLPPAIAQLPTGLPAELLLRRPDLRAAQQRLMAADSRVGSAVAAHYPSLTLSAGVGYALVDPTGLFWSLLGGLTAPIFQGNRIAGDVKLKKALLSQTLASYKVTLLRALQEVEDALVHGRQLQDRVHWLEASVTATEGALRMSSEQYAQGLISYLPVLTAEQSVYTARSNLISARRELVSARVQLARALGGGWMDRKIQRKQREREPNG